MRLVLRDVSPDLASAPADPPPLEEGRLVVGVAPETARIEREGRSFLLTDTSRHGVRVDGVDLVEGQRLPLRDGSHLVVGDRQYRAEIVGDLVAGDFDADGSAMPTISSILADVAPRGESASGPVPGRVHEEGVGERAPQRWRERDVSIGYGGPPETTREVLPLDWNRDFSSDTEHVAATRTRVSVRTLTPAAASEAPAPGAPASDALAALLVGAGVPGDAPDGDAQAVLCRARMLLAATLRGLHLLERDMRELYEAFDAEPPAVSAVDLADLLSRDDGEALLAGRFEALRNGTGDWQRAAADLIRGAREASPAAVKARVDAAGRTRFGAEARYWRAMVALNEEGGAPVTLEQRLSKTLRGRDEGR